MVGILGCSGWCSVDDGTFDGNNASLVKQINLNTAAGCSNLVLQRDLIGAVLCEIRNELEKVDIPVENFSRRVRSKKEGSNDEGFEDGRIHCEE